MGQNLIKYNPRIKPSEVRPVIGICNTWSELTPCNGHLRDIAEVVKRGVLEAGGVPFEFPVMSLGKILTREAFENAIIANAAVGGSTNLIIHLQAIAGRIGVPLELADFDQIGSHVPLLVNLMPSGKYLMEDYFYAGGLGVVINELKELLRAETTTVSSKSLTENYPNAQCYNREVIIGAFLENTGGPTR